jgi:hypothetical protein
MIDFSNIRIPGSEPEKKPTESGETKSETTQTTSALNNSHERTPTENTPARPALDFSKLHKKQTHQSEQKNSTPESSTPTPSTTPKPHLDFSKLHPDHKEKPQHTTPSTPKSPSPEQRKTSEDSRIEATGVKEENSEFIFDLTKLSKNFNDGELQETQNEDDSEEETFTGFNSLLSDLLDDDDEEEITSPTPTSTHSQPIIDTLPSAEKLPDEQYEDLEKANKAERERRKRNQEKSKARRKKGPKYKYESEFQRQPISEFGVDENGNPTTIKKADRAAIFGGQQASQNSQNSPSNWSQSSTAGSAQKRYTWVRSNGKLNGKELEFFRKNEALKSSRDRDTSAALLRRPIGVIETEKERLERIRRITRALGGQSAMRRNSGFKFGEKDRQTLEFLAMFRYATAKQLARMFSLQESTMYKRLKKLRLQGLVIDRDLYGAKPIWFLTSAGMMISGFELPHITEARITFSMLPHQFTVNNIAANLWGANVNVLNDPSYPQKNRQNEKGQWVPGEMLCSELEIQSSFGRVKMFEKSDVYRSQILGVIDQAFQEWEQSGGVNYGPSPEMIYGNEYMWALMPPYSVKLAYHVPDLVVKRERNPDGSPNSIAVEAEISNKSTLSYEKTLLAYKLDTRLYGKVVWVCKSKGPAQKLEKIAKNIGLWQEGRIDIVPIYTEDGVFMGRDLWTL